MMKTYLVNYGKINTGHICLLYRTDPYAIFSVHHESIINWPGDGRKHTRCESPPGSERTRHWWCSLVLSGWSRYNSYCGGTGWGNSDSLSLHCSLLKLCRKLQNIIHVTKATSINCLTYFTSSYRWLSMARTMISQTSRSHELKSWSQFFLNN